MKLVIYSNGKINPETQKMFAETTFNDVWLSMIQTVKKDNFLFEEKSIEPYFRSAFVKNYTGKTGRELKRISFETEYIKETGNLAQAQEKYKYHLHEIKEKFKTISDKCKALITLRYIERKDIDYIHQRFPEIQKENITKEISRCLNNLKLRNNSGDE